MADITTRLKNAACSIVVTRADGTVEDLGIVAIADEPDADFVQKLAERGLSLPPQGVTPSPPS